MTYKPVPSIGPTYQPKVTSPSIFTFNPGPTVIASVSCSLVGVSMFYQLSGMTDYAELAVASSSDQPVTTTQVTVLSGQTLNVYASKVGYTNSDVATYTNP